MKQVTASFHLYYDNQRMVDRLDAHSQRVCHSLVGHVIKQLDDYLAMHRKLIVVPRIKQSLPE